MNDSTSSVAGSLTRHGLTAGGVAGIINAQDDILRAVSLLITTIGLVWSIWEKLRRPAPPTPPAPTDPTLNLLLAFSLLPLAFALSGCGTTGDVAVGTTGGTNITTTVSIGNTNYTLGVTGGYDVASGQWSAGIAITFRDGPPSAETARLLADAGALPATIIRSGEPVAAIWIMQQVQTNQEKFALVTALRQGAELQPFRRQ